MPSSLDYSHILGIHQQQQSLVELFFLLILFWVISKGRGSYITVLRNDFFRYSFCNKFMTILLVLLTTLHVTVADEGREGNRNLTSQVLPVFYLSEIYNCSVFINILLDIVWQYEEQLLYGILSAIMLLIICYLKFGNLDQGRSGDNHSPEDYDGNGAADDGDFGRHYDAKNNAVRFSAPISETRPYSPSLPGFSMFVEKESNTEAFSNHVVMTPPAPMIFMANTQPTCISSGSSTIATSASATSTSSVIHFQCNNGLILKCQIEILDPPSESSSSSEHKPSNILYIADNIDQKEETQDFGTSCHTEVQGRPPDIPIISGRLNILTPGRNLVAQPAPIFLTCSPSGINSHYDDTNVPNKDHDEKSEETLDSGEEIISATSDDKGSEISSTHRPTQSKSLTHGNEELVVDLGEFLASTCGVGMNITPREEPIDKLPSSDSDHDMSEDGVVLQQPGDSLDSPCLLPLPVYRPGDFLCSMDDSFLKHFRSDYG